MVESVWRLFVDWEMIPLEVCRVADVRGVSVMEERRGSPVPVIPVTSTGKRYR